MCEQTEFNIWKVTKMREARKNISLRQRKHETLPQNKLNYVR